MLRAVFTSRTSLSSRRVSSFHKQIWTSRAKGDHGLSTQRFLSQSLSAILGPPVIFCGLLITLWTYKCLMMIIFQNKIIYMPGVPPGTRKERLENYQYQSKPFEWKEARIRSLDDIEIALCVGKRKECDPPQPQKPIIIVYFHGNAGSLPPRLPLLSNILREDTKDNLSARTTIVALSYRGYWHSHGKPSQKGIEMDAAAVLRWVQQQYQSAMPQPTLFLYGQSIGCGVAMHAAAAAHKQESAHQSNRQYTETSFPIRGIILETPFISIREMLVALYPQKWLPYRYLWPFLRSSWDSKVAIAQLRSRLFEKSSIYTMPPNVLILQAGKDEVVPSSHATEIQRFCKTENLKVFVEEVPDALHNEVLLKEKSRRAIRKFLSESTETYEPK